MTDRYAAAKPPRRLVLAVTVPLTARAFLRGQIRFAAECGWSVVLVSSPGPDLEAVAASEPVTVEPVAMARRISLGADLAALIGLCRLLRRVRPDVTNVGTPKAGLLVGLAAALTQVPLRIYTVRGLPMETARGPKRMLLWVMELIAIRSAHRVVCVSPSLRQRLADLRLAPLRRTCVLGSGSSNGVDATRFEPTPARLAEAAILRAGLGIPEEAPVVGFVGRLCRDKGIVELTDAWERIAPMHPEAWLLLVGDDDPGDPLPASTRVAIDNGVRVARCAWLADPAAAYHVMDILVLPTHREGFPNVPLEAAAAGRPVVTTNATGAMDSVLSDRTGLVVHVGDMDALAEAIGALLRDPERAAELGRAGRAWVTKEFRPERVWSALENLYESRASSVTSCR